MKRNIDNIHILFKGGTSNPPHKGLYYSRREILKKSLLLHICKKKINATACRETKTNLNYGLKVRKDGVNSK